MKQGGMRRQRGAVTLVGALFLIFVMVVLLASAQHMAASGINDTAQQSDGIEALFVAESGLERAAWRYSNGTACPALTGETASVARGDFTIQGAGLNGTLCKVRVSGTVGSGTAADAATRIIEGELTPPAGGGGWVAADRHGGDAQILHWSGSDWTDDGPYAALPYSNLNGITCAAPDDCWAVGDDRNNSEFIAHWNGTTWSHAGPYGAVPDVILNSVTCVSSADCWAVGNASSGGRGRGRRGGGGRGGGGSSNGEVIIHWNGSSWSRVGPNGSIPDVDLNSVACVSANDCWAVGNELGSGWNREVLLHWNGSSWSRAGPYYGVPSENLNSVYCVASNDCWAVGDSNGGELIIHWNGSSWSRSGPYGGIPDENLLDVHCATGNDCWAVGNSNGGELIIHWNGSSWSRSGPYGSVPNQDLFAVSMVSAAEGYAVGANGTAAVWNGSSWSGVSTPTNSDLNDVYMDGSSGSGGVTLAHWTEVIQ
jgi:hypothetical protein